MCIRDRNGTLHFSVLDGWWVEGYHENAGWALTSERTYDVHDFQDELDAETIYSILEDEIIKSFYERNNEGIPVEWIDMIKNTIALVGPNFTTGRMMQDYMDRYYLPQIERSRSIISDNYQKAREMAVWKQKIVEAWDSIQLIKTEINDGINNILKIGNEYPLRVEIDLKGLDCNDVGLEFIVVEFGLSLIHI